MKYSRVLVASEEEFFEEMFVTVWMMELERSSLDQEQDYS